MYSREPITHTATLGNVTQNGKKVFSDWSNAYPFVVSAITPDAPVITNVKVSGSTIKVTYKAAANATGYDVVLGTWLQERKR